MAARGTIAPFAVTAAATALAATSLVSLAALPSCARAPAAPAGRGCPANRVVLDGACVAPRDLSAYCGGSCRVVSCDGEGEALDLRTRACLPALTVRTLAARDRTVPDDARPSCRAGAALVVVDDRVACLPRSAMCPRSAPWDEARGACVEPAPCPPGSIREAGEGQGARAACVDVTRAAPGGSTGPMVDVARWARAALGPDGGEGAPRLCSVLATSPASFDVGSGGARTFVLEVELAFADNDVTRASARVIVAGAPPAGIALAERAASSLLVPLRALGNGRMADAASVTTRVSCTVRGGGPPLLLPRGP